MTPWIHGTPTGMEEAPVIKQCCSHTSLLIERSPHETQSRFPRHHAQFPGMRPEIRRWGGIYADAQGNLGHGGPPKKCPGRRTGAGHKTTDRGGGNRRAEKKRGCASGGCAWQGLSAVYMVERYFQAAFSRVLDQEPRFVWRELVFARLVKRDHRLRDLQHAGDPTLGEAKMFSDFSECCHWHII